MNWIIGFAISLGVGLVIVGLAHKWSHSYLGVQRPKGNAVAPWLLGLVERFFFTLVVAFDVTGAAVGMMAWLAVKMGANWGRVIGDPTDQVGQMLRARQAIGALLLGLLSMTFALIGGLICNRKIPLTDLL